MHQQTFVVHIKLLFILIMLKYEIIAAKHYFMKPIVGNVFLRCKIFPQTRICNREIIPWTFLICLQNSLRQYVDTDTSHTTVIELSMSASIVALKGLYM